MQLPTARLGHARAAARPAFPLTALAAELRDTAGRLDALDAGEPGASVQAVFSCPTGSSAPESARMFRLLGIHPGPDICAPAAASPHCPGHSRGAPSACDGSPFGSR